MATGSANGGWALACGVLAVATMPVAIAATRFSSSYDLLHAGFAIPLALALGGVAIVQARKVRAHADATLGHTRGRRLAAAGRILGIVGICAGCSGLIALAVYGVLTYSGSQG